MIIYYKFPLWKYTLLVFLCLPNHFLWNGKYVLVYQADEEEKHLGFPSNSDLVKEIGACQSFDKWDIWLHLFSSYVFSTFYKHLSYISVTKRAKCWLCVWAILVNLGDFFVTCYPAQSHNSLLQSWAVFLSGWSSNSWVPCGTNVITCGQSTERHVLALGGEDAGTRVVTGRCSSKHSREVSLCWITNSGTNTIYDASQKLELPHSQGTWWRKFEKLLDLWTPCHLWQSSWKMW